jgi:hypothetical protein
VTTLATEPWSVTSTTAWPAQWAAGQAGGGASVANSRGRLTPDRAGYRVVRRVLAGLGTSTAKRRTTGRLILSNVGESNVWLSGREVVGATDYFPSGYFVRLRSDLQSWKIGAGYGGGEYGPSSDSTIAGVTLAIAANDVIGFTIDVDGFTTSARLWNITAGQVEPTDWQSTWTDTDQAFPTGVPALSVGSGNTNVAYAEWTPVTVTDGASGVTSTGAASSVGSASATTTLTARSTGSASGTGTTSASPRVVGTSTATASGAGSAAATDTLAATSAGSAAAEGATAAASFVSVTSTATANAEGTASGVTSARGTSTGTATGSGAASGDGLLRTSAQAAAEAAGSASATTTAQQHATGTATGEGSAQASTSAPGTSRGNADGVGSAAAITRVVGTSTASSLSFGTTEAGTTLTATSTAGALGTGTAAALVLILRTIARAAAAGAGTVNATTTVKTGELPTVDVISATAHRRTISAALQPRLATASTTRAWKATAHADHP